MSTNKMALCDPKLVVEAITLGLLPHMAVNYTRSEYDYAFKRAARLVSSAGQVGPYVDALCENLSKKDSTRISKLFWSFCAHLSKVPLKVAHTATFTPVAAVMFVLGNAGINSLEESPISHWLYGPLLVWYHPASDLDPDVSRARFYFTTLDIGAIEWFDIPLPAGATVTAANTFLRPSSFSLCVTLSHTRSANPIQTVVPLAQLPGLGNDAWPLTFRAPGPLTMSTVGDHFSSPPMPLIRTRLSRRAQAVYFLFPLSQPKLDLLGYTPSDDRFLPHIIHLFPRRNQTPRWTFTPGCGAPHA